MLLWETQRLPFSDPCLLLPCCVLGIVRAPFRALFACLLDIYEKNLLGIVRAPFLALFGCLLDIYEKNPEHLG